jgi:AcrR family transcriptional regulator
MPKVDSARDRIRVAALELMARKGIAGTTTQEISRRARCSQAAIYKYWDGKDALAHRLFEDAHAVMLAEMEAGAEAVKDPSERVIGVLQGLLGHSRSHPAEYAFLFQVFHSDYARWLVPHPKPRDLVLRELKRGMQSGAIPPGNAGVKAALLLGMAVRLAFFERQSLIEGGAAAADAGLWAAAAAVLES